MRTLRQIGGLVRLCAAGRGGRIGLLLFALVFGLDLIGVYVTLRLVAWTADFYNALQKLAVEEAVRQIGVFFALIGVSAGLNLVATYLRKLVEIRWRTALTAAALDRWLGAKAYWSLWLQAQGENIDNPDQRIADDCRIFVYRLTTEGLELLSKIVAIFSYVALLWSLSTFPLAFSLFGWAVEIPRYMVWAAPIYVLIASGATHLLGAPLHKLNVDQQHREADFRFALARLRESIEPVALAGGEPAERAILDHRFQAIVANWRKLIRRDFILGLFTRPYFQTVLRIPLFLALPAFLAGKVTLGGLMQIGSAFQNVVTTLSWFIFSYRDLIELGAATARLDRFFVALDEAREVRSGIALDRSDKEQIALRDLSLQTPAGRALLTIPELSARCGELIWIKGASGIGKSTLLRAIAGLWPHGDGVVSLPPDAIVVLPQQAYAPLGGLHAAATYPSPPDMIGPDRIRAALADVGLQIQATADADDGDIVKRMSGGEKQRLALARLLIHRPRWVLLDEATSALDIDAERELLSLLRARLPDATFIFVAHRAPHGVENFTTIDMARFAEAHTSRGRRVADASLARSIQVERAGHVYI